jgi:hypothetical protein
LSYTPSIWARPAGKYERPPVSRARAVRKKAARSGASVSNVDVRGGRRLIAKIGDVAFLRELQDLVVADQGRRVFAVGEDDHGLPCHVVGRAPEARVLQREVERVVDAGGAVRADAADRRLQLRLLVREILEHGELVIELDDLGLIVRAERAHQAHRRRAHRGQVGLHRERAVHEDRERDGELLLGEEGQLLGDSVFEDLEVAGGEAGDVAVAAVGNRHIQVDDVDRGRKRRKRPLGLVVGPHAARRRDHADRAGQRASQAGPVPVPVSHGRLVLCSVSATPSAKTIPGGLPMILLTAPAPPGRRNRSGPRYARDPGV